MSSRAPMERPSTAVAFASFTLRGRYREMEGEREKREKEESALCLTADYVRGNLSLG